MSSFIMRYNAGEREAVHSELVRLGEKVFDPMVQPDAILVAKAIVDRCVVNLRLLFHRLCNLGYQFKHPQHAFVEASQSDQLLIQTAESQYGAFPLILQQWYTRIASLDFSQSEEQLFGKPMAQSADLFGLGLNTPLVVLSIPNSIELLMYLKKRQVIKDCEKFWPLGGWCSNSDPTGFLLPARVFDATIDNDADGGAFLIDEIRGAFEGGGFPFWRRLLTGRKMAHPIPRVPNYAMLFPQLTEGLSSI